MPEILIATDSDRVAQHVEAALGGADTTFVRCTSGKAVLAAVGVHRPDLALLDLQMGNMGGMATCMALRNEHSGGRLPAVPVVMLLDRTADVFLARRSGAEGWLVKPLDALRLRRAATAVRAGGTYTDASMEPAPAEPATGESAGTAAVAAG